MNQEEIEAKQTQAKQELKDASKKHELEKEKRKQYADDLKQYKN